jgi:hypothetical protein
MPYYPQPPQTIIGQLYKFEYTHVSIHYVPSIIAASGITSFQAQGFPLRLVIKSPSSKLPGLKQSLSTTQTIIIPVNGLIDLHLVPSSLYSPEGLYSVSLFETGNNIPLSKTNWRVPYSNHPVTQTIVRGPSDMDYVSETIPMIGATTSFQGGDFTIEDGYIRWALIRPNEGDSYQITYTPPVTLDQLVVESLG